MKLFSQNDAQNLIVPKTNYKFERKFNCPQNNLKI